MSDPGSNPPVAPGDILAGKYRVERVLGAGGMGVVVQALHLELEQRVAVKFLLPHAVESPEAAARFVREARAAVKIRSEHVARVIDVGRLETGAPYIVMEFLEGSDLAAVVAHGPTPLEDAVEYVLQACEAMADAHSVGIVHRDLKPSNLFLTRRSDGSASIKVLDFGISKVLQTGAAEVALTRTSALIGSPLYMSPEQLRSARTVDHRADIWSLGVILFELLSGEPPFMAETLPQLIASILTDPPLSLRSKRPDLPAELELAVASALQKDPDRRFRNVGELALALVPFAPRRSRHVTERILRVSGMDVPSSNDPPENATPGTTVPHASSLPQGTRTNDVWSGTQAGAKGKSSGARVTLVAALVALGFAAVAWATLRSRPPEAVVGTAAPEPVISPPPVVTLPKDPAAVAVAGTALPVVPPAPLAPAASTLAPATTPTAGPGETRETRTPLAPSHAAALGKRAPSKPARAPDPSPAFTPTPAPTPVASAAAPAAPKRAKNPLSLDLK